MKRVSCCILFRTFSRSLPQLILPPIDLRPQRLPSVIGEFEKSVFIICSESVKRKKGGQRREAYIKLSDKEGKTYGQNKEYLESIALYSISRESSIK